MLTLEPLPGPMSIARFEPDALTPAWLERSPIVATLRSDRELSILCATAAIPDDERAAATWRHGFIGWRIAGELDFEMVGVLARITGALAARAVPAMAISSFQTDYILVGEADHDAARDALLSAGFAVGEDLPPEAAGRIEKVTLARAMASFPEAWSPRIIADVNDCQVKLARLRGPFVWHHHEHEDELFLVIKGSLRMFIRNGGQRGERDGRAEREIRLDEGECIRIPRGVEHMPIADEECHVLLVEPATTRNTGNVVSDRSKAAVRLGAQ
jgi:mannose-6-phosphate isomerase-like protein (cupin superfamily)